MAYNFDSACDEYMEAYEGCNPEAFLSEMQTELDRRIEAAKQYE